MSALGTMWLRRIICTAAAASAVVLGSACSSDDVAERLTESLSGDDVEVDIDSDSGEVKIETDDGSMQFSTDQLPEGFPQDIPLPDDLDLMSSRSTDVGDGAAFSLVGTVDGEASEVFDPLAKQFRDAGWNETDTGTVTMSGTTTTSATFENADWRVSLIVNETGGESTVTYAVTAASN